MPAQLATSNTQAKFNKFATHLRETIKQVRLSLDSLHDDNVFTVMEDLNGLHVQNLIEERLCKCCKEIKEHVFSEDIHKINSALRHDRQGSCILLGALVKLVICALETLNRSLYKLSRRDLHTVYMEMCDMLEENEDYQCVIEDICFKGFLQSVQNTALLLPCLQRVRSVQFLRTYLLETSTHHGLQVYYNEIASLSYLLCIEHFTNVPNQENWEIFAKLLFDVYLDH